MKIDIIIEVSWFAIECSDGFCECCFKLLSRVRRKWFFYNAVIQIWFIVFSLNFISFLFKKFVFFILKKKSGFLLCKLRSAIFFCYYAMKTWGGLVWDLYEKFLFKALKNRLNKKNKKNQKKGLTCFFFLCTM